MIGNQNKLSVLTNFAHNGQKLVDKQNYICLTLAIQDSQLHHHQTSCCPKTRKKIRKNLSLPYLRFSHWAKIIANMEQHQYRHPILANSSANFYHQNAQNHKKLFYFLRVTLWRLSTVNVSPPITSSFHQQRIVAQIYGRDCLMNIKGMFRKPEKFTNYEPDSPASRAARKWDER